MNRHVKKIVDKFNKDFGQDVTEAGILVCEQEIYLSTFAVSNLLNVVPHYFSVNVSRKLQGKVDVIKRGRGKWYLLEEVVALYKKSIKDGVTVASLC